jgi:cyclophilin family peptidyl-prolyl cis-trans isomerase
MDGKNVAFGKVVEGMDVLRKIEAHGSMTGTTEKKIVITNSGQL